MFNWKTQLENAVSDEQPQENNENDANNSPVLLSELPTTPDPEKSRKLSFLKLIRPEEKKYYLNRDDLKSRLDLGKYSSQSLDSSIGSSLVSLKERISLALRDPKNPRNLEISQRLSRNVEIVEDQTVLKAGRQLTSSNTKSKLMLITNKAARLSTLPGLADYREKREFEADSEKPRISSLSIESISEITHHFDTARASDITLQFSIADKEGLVVKSGEKRPVTFEDASDISSEVSFGYQTTKEESIEEGDFIIEENKLNELQLFKEAYAETFRKAISTHTPGEKLQFTVKIPSVTPFGQKQFTPQTKEPAAPKKPSILKKEKAAITAKYVSDESIGRRPSFVSTKIISSKFSSPYKKTPPPKGPKLQDDSPSIERQVSFIGAKDASGRYVPIQGKPPPQKTDTSKKEKRASVWYSPPKDVLQSQKNQAKLMNKVNAPDRRKSTAYHLKKVRVSSDIQIKDFRSKDDGINANLEHYRYKENLQKGGKKTETTGATSGPQKIVRKARPSVRFNEQKTDFPKKDALPKKSIKPRSQSIDDSSPSSYSETYKVIYFGSEETDKSRIASKQSPATVYQGKTTTRRPSIPVSTGTQAKVTRQSADLSAASTSHGRQESLQYKLRDKRRPSKVSETDLNRTESKKETPIRKYRKSIVADKASSGTKSSQKPAKRQSISKKVSAIQSHTSQYSNIDDTEYSVINYDIEEPERDLKTTQKRLRPPSITITPDKKTTSRSKETSRSSSPASQTKTQPRRSSNKDKTSPRRSSTPVAGSFDEKPKRVSLSDAPKTKEKSGTKRRSSSAGSALQEKPSPQRPSTSTETRTSQNKIVSHGGVVTSPEKGTSKRYSSSGRKSSVGKSISEDKDERPSTSNAPTSKRSSTQGAKSRRPSTAGSTKISVQYTKTSSGAIHEEKTTPKRVSTSTETTQDKKKLRHPSTADAATSTRKRSKTPVKTDGTRRVSTSSGTTPGRISPRRSPDRMLTQPPTTSTGTSTQDEVEIEIQRTNILFARSDKFRTPPPQRPNTPLITSRYATTDQYDVPPQRPNTPIRRCLCRTNARLYHQITQIESEISTLEMIREESENAMLHSQHSIYENTVDPYLFSLAPFFMLGSSFIRRI